MHCTPKSLLTHVFKPALHRPSALPPSFLIPSLVPPQTTPFSTSFPSHARKDRNPNRGVSALRRTGLRRRQKLSVKLSDLPKPVLDPRRRSAVEVDENHGLWDFFNRDRTSLSTPAELGAHGRAWTVPELRNKDWDDLWRLWWMCVKERNKVATFLAEKERMGEMFGSEEAEERMKQVKMTQKSIKHVLTERWYAWENARYAAMDDPEVNLYADPDQGDLAYIPKPQGEEDDVADALERESIQSSPEESGLPPPERTGPGSEARM